MDTLSCILTDHEVHSADVVEVWHGLPVPVRLCGYHESRTDTRREGFRRNHETAREVRS